MNIREIIASQYHSSLSMLEVTIEKTPADLWEAGDSNPIWHVAYHALFYTHLYLQPTENDFVPWSHHRNNSQYLGQAPGTDHEQPQVQQPYSAEQILDYSAFCKQEVDRRTPHLDLDAASGFHWLPMTKLELQIYSIRHIMQHVGELSGRLYQERSIVIDWVGMTP